MNNRLAYLLLTSINMGFFQLGNGQIEIRTQQDREKLAQLTEKIKRTKEQMAEFSDKLQAGVYELMVESEKAVTDSSAKRSLNSKILSRNSAYLSDGKERLLLRAKLYSKLDTTNFKALIESHGGYVTYIRGSNPLVDFYMAPKFIRSIVKKPIIKWIKLPMPADVSSIMEFTQKNGHKVKPV